MATHSCVLAWKIPWLEKPGGVQSMDSPRVGRLSHWAHRHGETHCRGKGGKSLFHVEALEGLAVALTLHALCWELGSTLTPPTCAFPTSFLPFVRCCETARWHGGNWRLLGAAVGTCGAWELRCRLRAVWESVGRRTMWACRMQGLNLLSAMRYWSWHHRWPLRPRPFALLRKMVESGAEGAVSLEPFKPASFHKLQNLPLQESAVFSISASAAFLPFISNWYYETEGVFQQL